jgi:hypothetical protein
MGIFFHLLLISYNEPELQFEFYAEANFLVFGVYSILPTLYELHKMQKERWLFAILLLCFSMGIFRIYNFHSPYTERIQYLESLVEEMEHNKEYIEWESCEKEVLSMEWAVPYETALLSALHNEKISKTIFVKRDALKDPQGLQKTNAFLNVFKIIHTDSFYQRWVEIPEEYYSAHPSIQY